MDFNMHQSVNELEYFLHEKIFLLKNIKLFLNI